MRLIYLTHSRARTGVKSRTYDAVHVGACAEGIDSYGCLCRQGFSGCNCLEEVDECASTPCRFGGACNPMVRLIAYEP